MQVQEFEHINGYYSMPELIRKPCEPASKVAGAVDVKPGALTAEGETPKSATTSTSATPATSAAASPAPGSQDTPSADKDKEVILTNNIPHPSYNNNISPSFLIFYNL